MATKIEMKAKIGSMEVGITAEIEKFSQQNLLKILNSVEELTIQKCGLCDSTSVRARVRVHGTYTYYELVCRDCEATLQFHERKDQTGMYTKEWQEPYAGKGEGGGAAPESDPWN